MATKDQVSNLSIILAIAPVVVADNTAQVGALIDSALYESVSYALVTGTITDADMTVTALLQEGDLANGSDLATVAAADIVGALPAITFASDLLTFKFGYRGTKRYTKLTLTPVNNTGSFPISAVVILGHYRHAPAP
jgi:hypothetical protein